MTYIAVSATGREHGLAQQLYCLPGITWRGLPMCYQSPAHWESLWAPHRTFELRDQDKTAGYAVFAVDMKPTSGLWSLDLAVEGSPTQEKWAAAYDAALAQLRREETVCRVFTRVPTTQVSTTRALQACTWTREGTLAGQYLINHQRIDAEQWSWTEPAW